MRKCLSIFHQWGASGVFCALALGACTTLEAPWRGAGSSGALQTPEIRDCAGHFSALNAAVERAGVHDAEAYPIAGFPYLRVDRFSASLGNLAGDGGPAAAQWLLRLQALDQAARRVEISNLPEDEIKLLQADGGGRAALLAKTAGCAERLRDFDSHSPEQLALIRERAHVPDAYLTWQRVAGLYSLISVPFAARIEHSQQQTLDEFKRSAQSPTPAQDLLRYSIAQNPAQSGAPVVPISRDQVAAMIRRASDNPLHIPEFTDEEKALLLRAYAPVFELESGADYDRFGRLAWGNGSTPQVDTAVPVVYSRIAYTRLGAQSLAQLVYTIWFPQRPADHALDILAGRLDGVIIRVTLSTDGDPLVVDSIHPCGCYHQFFPTANVQALPAPVAAGEWAFAPTTLPAHTVGAHIAVRIATRSHYLNHVALDQAASTHGYTLVPEDELRSLPTLSASQGRRSIYGPDGFVAGTARLERWLFWPMGIPNAGAMRQWGHHATAFVGRRHFDDADLIEKRFQIKLPVK